MSVAYDIIIYIKGGGKSVKPNREFEKVVAGYRDGSGILFKMKNGYFYLRKL
jgi:hypothetical protein